MPLKVLVVEDHESVGLSIRKTLEELNVTQVDYAHYCDDAYAYFKNSLEKAAPYDLVITDLHFAIDHRPQNIQSGKELSKRIKELHPATYLIVFSAESNPAIIKSLYDEYMIDGYVKKSRGDAKELRKAIDTVVNGSRYISQETLIVTRKQQVHQFTDYDIQILTLMIKGKKQKEIAEYFKEKNIQPSALSSIEKRLKQIKSSMKFDTNEQMIAYCMKMEIIEYPN